MPNKSNRRWLREHFSDPYVKKAHIAGFRSRSVFKLQELQARDKLIKPGMTVIDIGSAPGGWSELVSQYVGKNGHVIAMDLLPMKPIQGVTFIQGDFTDIRVIKSLMDHIGNLKVDWVISDLAPNLTGIDSVDQSRSIFLCEQVINFATQVLKREGGLLIKVFQGEGFDAFLAQMRHHFTKVVIRKPKASRGRSKEVYLLGKISRL